MKTLFLASYFTCVSDLLLPILPKKPNELRLAFVPTAADPYESKSWFYEDKNKLIAMGFLMKEIDIKNKTKEKLYEELDDVNVLFISGGNTYYLLEKARESGFDEVVKNLVGKGVIYLGSSAGTALACSTIEYVEDFDDKSITRLKTYEGLNFTNKLIMPHYGDERYEVKFQTILDKWRNKGYQMLPLKNSQVLVIQDDKEEVKEVLIPS